MKIFFSILFLFGIISNSHAQNSFGVHFGVGSGSVLEKTLMGGSSNDLRSGFSIGFQYDNKIKDRLHVSVGATWYKGRLVTTPNGSVTGRKHTLQLVYIPVFLRADIGRRLFVNGGLLGDIDITKERTITNQSGLGAGIGAGIDFPLSETFSIQLNPYLNFHGLLLTKAGNHPQRVADTGLKIVLMFRND